MTLARRVPGTHGGRPGGPRAEATSGSPASGRACQYLEQPALPHGRRFGCDAWHDRQAADLVHHRRRPRHGRRHRPGRTRRRTRRRRHRTQPRKVAAAVGAPDDLFTVKLDITDPADADAAVQTAVDRFGRIDVLVNNAGNFYAGFFEEITPEDFRAQIETNLFGPLNVTRAVLPVMRAQRSGLIVTMSSTAGITGQEFVSAYAASKFGIEGWIESLTPEVAPFGIRTMLVEPGFFRTDLLEDNSTIWPEPRSTTTPSAPARPLSPGRA